MDNRLRLAGSPVTSRQRGGNAGRDTGDDPASFDDQAGLQLADAVVLGFGIHDIWAVPITA